MQVRILDLITILLVSAVDQSSAAGSSPPRLFAVQNWIKSTGPPLDLTWRSWRLVEVATDGSGKLTSVMGWFGGVLPNQAGDANGRLLGAAYDTEAGSRNTIVVDVGSGVAKTYDVRQGRAGSDDTLVFSGSVHDECQGFFTAVLPDDLSPPNTVFSVYDLSVSLSGPSHVVSVNNTQLTATAHLAHNRAPGGASVARSIIYLALRAFEGHPSSQRLYKIHRYTAAVEELDWSLIGSANLTVGALHVGSKDESLLVIACHEAFDQDCTLYELDTANKTSRMMLSLPGLDPGPALGYCKSFDEQRNMLYLGCNNVTIVDLSHEAVVDTHVIDFGTASSGGSYSSGGIVVV